MRRTLIALAVLLAGAPSAHAAETCAQGSAAAAARALYGAELVSTGRVAGVRTALALQPLVAPGTRRRMVRTADGWCDAATGFNRTGLTGRAAALAFARLAAAPYFDRVRVLSVAERDGAYVLRTHAATNGVVARWAIVADERGIASATWTATDFARQPLTGQVEGLTALPGATETYVRGAGGLLAERRGLDGLLRRARARQAPGIADYVGPDGMTLSVSLGDSHVAIDPGADAGEYHADIVRWTLRALKVNYEDYLSWGMTKGWTSRYDALLPDRGFVAINDALSAYCLACVLIGEEFNIHLLSEFPTALTLLGYTYTDAVKAFDDVVGHEMFHNFQNRYYKPGQPGELGTPRTATGYSEGTARFQETLHASYSDVNRTPDTLYNTTDTNGCNGFDTGTSMNAAMASGPVKSYNSCYFWSAWYGAFGPDAFLKLVTEAIPAHAAEADGTKETLLAMTDAAGVPLLAQLEAFAVAALTGRNLSWGPLAGGDAYDWGQGLERWEPAQLGPGGNASAALANGGMLARELTGAATVSITASPDLDLFVVRDGPAGATVTDLPDSGGPVAAPAAGERVWAVVARPSPGQTPSATLRAR